MAAVPGVKYDSSPLAPPSVASGTVCNGKARPVCCRILNEYEMFPSAKRLVSGNAENALSPHRPKGKIFQPPTRSAELTSHLNHSHIRTFAFSPRSSNHPPFHHRSPIDIEITDDDLLRPSLHLVRYVGGQEIRRMVLQEMAERTTCREMILSMSRVGGVGGSWRLFFLLDGGRSVVPRPRRGRGE